MIDDAALSADAIRAAHRAIHPAFTNSPQFVHDGLSARLGVPVIVKVETVNPIRSFKGRGTWVAIDALVRDGILGTDRPVVCASAGNFGQGVAFAAGPAGVRSVVFASTRANRGPTTNASSPSTISAITMRAATTSPTAFQGKGLRGCGGYGPPQPGPGWPQPVAWPGVAHTDVGFGPGPGAGCWT